MEIIVACHIRSFVCAGKRNRLSVRMKLVFGLRLTLVTYYAIYFINNITLSISSLIENICVKAIRKIYFCSLSYVILHICETVSNERTNFENLKELNASLLP